MNEQKENIRKQHTLIKKSWVLTVPLGARRQNSSTLTSLCVKKRPTLDARCKLGGEITTTKKKNEIRLNKLIFKHKARNKSSKKKKKKRNTRKITQTIKQTHNVGEAEAAVQRLIPRHLGLVGKVAKLQHLEANLLERLDDTSGGGQVRQAIALLNA